MNNIRSEGAIPGMEPSDAPVAIARVRVGRVVFEGVILRTREAGIEFQELLHTVCDKTRSTRLRKDGTRYHDALPVGSPARLLSVEIKDYLNDMDRRELKQSTISATARTLEILRIACGDVPVSRIDHKHIYLLWDLLRWAPPGLTSDATLKGMCAEDLIARGKALAVPSPARETFELHRRFLNAFFNALEDTRAIPHSPMAAFAERKKSLIVDPDQAERLFSDENLQKMFDPATFVPWALKYPHRWWGPMLGLYLGARINEVAQLKVADILEERGTWCIAIRMTADADLAKDPRRRSRTRQSLKGKSAVRTLPIPQPLLDAGFLDFVEDMKACGHPRLFPHLSAGVNQKTGDTNARYSQGLLSQFGRYLKDLGFPKGVGFHAFRHTLATDLDHQGVRVEDVALITGHSVSKKVPVLQDHYYHKKPDAIRLRQKTALALYRPNVTLPTYARGQFKELLTKQYKFYP